MKEIRMNDMWWVYMQSVKKKKRTKEHSKINEGKNIWMEIRIGIEKDILAKLNISVQTLIETTTHNAFNISRPSLTHHKYEREILKKKMLHWTILM